MQANISASLVPYLNFTTAAPRTEAGGDDSLHMYQRFSFYCACVMVVLCGIGLLGNALSIYIFSRKNMRSSINVLLTGLSCIDFLLLLVIVPIFAMPALNVNEVVKISQLSNYLVLYGYPVSMMLQTASVWLFMLITTERYLAVCHPLKVGLYCSATRSKFAISIVVLLAICYNFIRFFEYQPYFDDVTNFTWAVPRLRNNEIYWTWYATVLFNVTQMVIPFLLIAIFNTKIVLAIIEAKKQRALLTLSERTEHKTALMMVTVIVLFFCCCALAFVLNIIEAVDYRFFERESSADFALLLVDLSNTLITVNSAVTFVIYLIFSRKYRFTLKALCFNNLPQSCLRLFMSDEDLAKLEWDLAQATRASCMTRTQVMMRDGTGKYSSPLSRPVSVDTCRRARPSTLLMGQKRRAFTNGRNGLHAATMSDANDSTTEMHTFSTEANLEAQQERSRLLVPDDKLVENGFWTPRMRRKSNSDGNVLFANRPSRSCVATPL